MNNSLNNARKVWEHCIFETMLLRRHCINRPSLYFTESGCLILDARPIYPVDISVVESVAVVCDIIAEEYGFSQDTATGAAYLFVWKKGGTA